MRTTILLTVHTVFTSITFCKHNNTRVLLSHFYKLNLCVFTVVQISLNISGNMNIDRISSSFNQLTTMLLSVLVCIIDVPCYLTGISIIRHSYLGRIIRHLFLVLHAVCHCTEAMVCSVYPNQAAASACVAIIFGQIASRIPWFLHSKAVSMQLPRL